MGSLWNQCSECRKFLSAFETRFTHFCGESGGQPITGAFMAHKCGFTEKSLNIALASAGFAAIVSKRRSRGLDLWAVATKNAQESHLLGELAGQMIPQ
jgi:hypothetical protein